MEQHNYICEMNHIYKKYKDKVLFEDFELKVKENEMICIAGKSGSGKSTILNMLGMFEKPDCGEIKLFGENLPDPYKKAGRMLMKEKIFYLFQNFALVEHESIGYNLEIPIMEERMSKKEKKIRKEEALKAVGLTMDLKEKIYHLSGGEQQRVAIARGYLKRFELLLADEPTGSLDGYNRDEIISIMKTFHQNGKTIVIVSHDPEVMRQCQRVIHI